MRAAHKEVNMEQTFKIGDEQWERLNDAMMQCLELYWSVQISCLQVRLDNCVSWVSIILYNSVL